MARRPPRAVDRPRGCLRAARRATGVGRAMGRPTLLLASAFLLAGCGVLGLEPAWGPLAVGPPSGDDARIEGTVRIDGRCVFLEVQGEDVLLVWPVDRTTWDPVGGDISFLHPDGDVIEVRSGDAVALGGSGTGGGEDPAGDAWLGRVDWVAPPARECLGRGGAWFVSDVLPGG